MGALWELDLERDPGGAAPWDVPRLMKMGHTRAARGFVCLFYFLFSHEGNRSWGKMIQINHPMGYLVAEGGEK